VTIRINETEIITEVQERPVHPNALQACLLPENYGILVIIIIHGTEVTMEIPERHIHPNSLQAHVLSLANYLKLVTNRIEHTHKIYGTTSYIHSA